MVTPLLRRALHPNQKRHKMPSLTRSENVCSGCRSRKKKCDVSYLPQDLARAIFSLKAAARANALNVPPVFAEATRASIALSQG